jgi:hypothetical protein
MSVSINSLVATRQGVTCRRIEVRPVAGHDCLREAATFERQESQHLSAVPLENLISPVKLMPGYMCELPLWGRSWQSLNLPASPLDRLTDWQDYFDVSANTSLAIW